MNKTEFVEAAKLLAANGKFYKDITWDRHRLSLLNHIISGDELDAFLRWSTLVATMVVGDVPYVYDNLADLAIDESGTDWLMAMIDNNLGQPARLVKFPQYTGTFVNQAHNLMVWQNATGCSVKDIHRIVEFGGGFGAMCALINRLGFVGEYHLFDYPEFLLLQRYYLEGTGLPATTLANIHYREVDGVGRFDLPPEDVDLLIGCHSLSEAPRELRNAFIDMAYADSILIVSQDVWDDVDMGNEWRHFSSIRRNYNWQQIDYYNIPGHFYLIGNLVVKYGEIGDRHEETIQQDRTD